MNFGRISVELSKFPGLRFRYFDEIGSTNDEALQWLDEGAEEYSLVIADAQTRGRGRLERKWHTQKGAGLAFSVILKPAKEEIPNLQMFSPLGAAAVCSALKRNLNLPAEIKWPNDVLINRRKVCGILSEALWHGSTLKGLVIGIGVNISPDSVPERSKLLFPATSVENELGRQADRWALLADILKELITWRSRLLTLEFHEYWKEHLAFMGEPVKVEVSPEKTVAGRLRSVAMNGNLEIELQTGEMESFTIGDVHLRSGDEAC